MHALASPPPRAAAISLDESQAMAVDLMQSGCNVFLTGNAGTGKSTVVTAFLSQALRPFEVTASTGVAALNLRDQFYARSGGKIMLQVSTIYRWAGINLGPMAGESNEACLSRLERGAPPSRLAAWQRVRRAECLIIDEISMLPGRILSYLEFHCRTLRGVDKPWGGLQVIAVGDFLQLPPVAKDGKYDWAFLSEGWKRTCFANVCLTKIHRQGDPVFTGLLNAVRVGQLNADHMAILRKRVAVFPSRELLRLFTHNTQVNAWNSQMLEGLDGPEIVFDMEKEGLESECEFLVKNLLTPERLALRQGARVMVTVNLTGEGNTLLAVNGSLGKVAGWGTDGVTPFVDVDLDDGRKLFIPKYRWNADPIRPDLAWVEQFPLRLAWAATIHKSQGLSLDAALIDARATREPGQTYVALSRVRSLGGLWLRDIFSGVWVSPEAIKFMQGL